MRIRPWIAVVFAVVLGPTQTWRQVPAQRTAAALAVAEGVVYLSDEIVEAKAVPSVARSCATLASDLVKAVRET